MQIIEIYRLTRVVDVLTLISDINRRVKNLPKKGSAIYLKFPEKSIYFPPFSMMLLGMSLRQISEANNCLISFINFDSDWLGYAKFFGFFKIYQTKSKPDDFNMKARENYVPIQCLHVPDVSIDDDDVHASEVERMQTLGEDLAKKLLKTEEGDSFDTLSYLCREILRNIIEHSYSERMYYAAQYYPGTNKVEVVVADEGEGLKEGLNQNPKLNITDDREAIKFAILPGISGRSHKYGRRSSSEEHIYRNSGYGLYLTHRICAEAGSFVLISGSSGIMANKSSKRYLSDFKFDFKGTFLRLSIELDKLGGIEDKIIHYRNDAERIMKSTRKIEDVTPSAASMMLKLD